jgi:ferritin-like metal-binding protein YciE
MADANSLRDLFVQNLRRTYDAEQRLAKALPKMRDAATSDELRHAFQTHYEETVVHADRLDQVFGWFDEKPRADTCEAIKGIIEDSKDVLKLDAEASVKDAALIAAAQEAEHFEIGSYGTLRTWATALERNDAMQVLEVTLEEEKNADALLTNIAATLNLKAAHQAP